MFNAVFERCCYTQREKGKRKRHTLDTSPLGEGTSLQKRSSVARVGDGFYSFTCTRVCVYPRMERTITAFAFPADVGSHLTTPGRMKGRVGLGTTTFDVHSSQTLILYTELHAGC